LFSAYRVLPLLHLLGDESVLQENPKRMMEDMPADSMAGVSIILNIGGRCGRVL
jgi:hypothetical protein